MSNQRDRDFTEPSIYSTYHQKFEKAGLPTTQQAWIQRAKDVADILGEDAASRDIVNKSPRAEVSLLKSSGLLKVLGPKRYGGGEQSWETGYKVIREVAKTDGSLGMLLGYHLLWSTTANVVGTAEQADSVQQVIIQNNFFVGGAVNPRDSDLKITSEGDEIVFNGFKNFNTGGVISDLTVLEGVLDGTEDHIFTLVKTDQAGIQFSHNWDSVGLRLTESGSVKISNIRVPWSDALGWDAHSKKPDPSVLGIPFASLLLPTIQLVFSNFYLGIAQLRTENANLMLDNQNASAKLTILRGDLTAAKNGMQASDEQNQNLTVEIERLMSSETLLIAGNTTLKSTNDKLKSEISTCQSSLEELQATNLKLQVALDEKEASSQKQSAKVANQQQRISELEQAGDVSRSRAEAKITEMKTALDQRTTDLDLKSEQLDACQGENKQLQKDIAALKGNLAAAKNDNSRVRQECETAMKAVDQKTAEFKSLQEQIAGLHSRAVPNTQVALDMSVAQSKAEHKTPAGRVDLHSDELSSEQLHIIYKSYERFDNRYQVQHKGMIVPRPTNRKAWIGSVHAENMLGILSKEDHDAFLSPYREISDLKLEILVDGRVLPRGFADLPASREERHALEEAGVSIAESDEGASAFGNAMKSGTRHGELSKRDLALKEKMKADREANEQDPRLRSLPAPVAVMVAPEAQADGSVNVKEPLPPKPHDEPVKKPLSRKPGPDVAVQQLPGRLETGSTTEIDSVQTPALTHDEGMSPKETGPITPRSPRPSQSQAAPGALKRKAPVELFDAPKGPARQPERSVDLLDTRSRWLDSGEEAHNKRVRLASQQDALDRAPRGPRGFRESRKGFYDSRREDDTYWSSRTDGEGSNYDRSRAREAYYNLGPRQPAFERRDSRRRSSEYYSDYRVDDRRERWYDRSG